MIDALKRLCQQLAAENVTAQSISESIGTIIEAGGPGKPYTVRPKDDAFTAATVVVDQDGSTPATVTLTTAKPISLDALETAFPDHARTPTRGHGGIDNETFYVEVEGQPFTCALIAPVQNDGHEIIVRRDMRLV